MVPGRPAAHSRPFETYKESGCPYFITKPLNPLSETKRLLPPPKIKKGNFNFFATLIALIKSFLFFATKKYFAGPPILKVVYFFNETFFWNLRFGIWDFTLKGRES